MIVVMVQFSSDISIGLIERLCELVANFKYCSTFVFIRVLD